MSSFGYELKSLRAKLARLLDIYESFSSHAVPMEEWPFWLEKFNALASQYTSLQKEVSLALESAVIEPIAVSGNIDHIPGVLLRSKVPPEVEATESFNALPIASEDWKAQIQRLNELIDHFCEEREAFEDHLKTSTAPKSQPADMATAIVEPAIRFMYTGI